MITQKIKCNISLWYSELAISEGDVSGMLGLMTKSRCLGVAERFEITGFLLIEAAISLLIVGIVSSMCMIQLASFTAIDRMRRTQENCNVVINALGAYFIATDGRLPDPVGEITDGFGNVPFKSLGIMEKFSMDGNGRKLLYKVNSHLGRHTEDMQYIRLGVDDFVGSYEDKVIVVLKSVDLKGSELYKIWHSERNFKNMFRIHRKPEFSENADTEWDNNSKNIPHAVASELEDE
jgi:hypothetical protein